MVPPQTDPNQFIDCSQRLGLAFYLLIVYISDMKNLLLISFLVPAMAMAQSSTDYEKTLAKFVKYYNAGNSKKIVRLFNDESQDAIRPVFSPKAFERIRTEEGRILSFSYIGEDGTDPHPIKVFKVNSSKGVYALAFSLGADGKFRTYRHMTTSEHIDSLLRSSR